MLDERQHEAADLHIKTEALAHYSHLFYLDDERRRQVVDLSRSLPVGEREHPRH